jgi:transposase
MQDLGGCLTWMVVKPNKNGCTLDRSVVVWVGEGKGRETIDKFFNSMLSDYQKNQITAGSCDMSEAYIGAIKTHCPNATLVLDRFHIMKALNAAVDEVRKEQMRLLI